MAQIQLRCSPKNIAITRLRLIDLNVDLLYWQRSQTPPNNARQPWRQGLFFDSLNIGVSNTRSCVTNGRAINAKKPDLPADYRGNNGHCVHAVF